MRNAFIRIQIAAINACRHSIAKQQTLESVFERLGIRYKTSNNQQNNNYHQPQRNTIEQAYEKLGANKKQSIKEIERSYRKLLNKHHPDRLIAQGKTEEDIYSFLSEKYGNWILYKPKFNLETFLLWSLPYLVLVAGGLIIVLFVRKRVKKE